MGSQRATTGRHFRVFNREVHFDDASRDYKIAPLLAAMPKKRRRTVGAGPTLDQGAEGACTGFGAAHVLNSRGLHRRHPLIDDKGARDIYEAAKRADDWEGEDYEGSSVLGAMRALKALNVIKGYRWIGAGSGTPVQDLIDTLRYVSSVELGTDWYASMGVPSWGGHLEVSPGGGGGHAYHAFDTFFGNLLFWGDTVRTKREWIVIQNSWGPRWGITYKGVGGCAFIAASDMATLLDAGGEGAVPYR